MAIRKLGFIYTSVWLKIETAHQVLEEVFHLEFQYLPNRLCVTWGKPCVAFVNKALLLMSVAECRSCPTTFIESL
jgi:hypothetical protein